MSCGSELLLSSTTAVDSLEAIPITAGAVRLRIKLVMRESDRLIAEGQQNVTGAQMPDKVSIWGRAQCVCR
jgi:hypothetical protein